MPRKGSTLQRSTNGWIRGYFVPILCKLVAGRNITTTDSIKEFIVNETLVKKLGFSNPQDVLNKEINLWNGFAVGPIVGVVRDFHPSSLKGFPGPCLHAEQQKGFQCGGDKDWWNEYVRYHKVRRETLEHYLPGLCLRIPVPR